MINKNKHRISFLLVGRWVGGSEYCWKRPTPEISWSTKDGSATFVRRQVTITQEITGNKYSQVYITHSEHSCDILYTCLMYYFNPLSFIGRRKVTIYLRRNRQREPMTTSGCSAVSWVGYTVSVNTPKPCKDLSLRLSDIRSKYWLVNADIDFILLISY